MIYVAICPFDNLNWLAAGSLLVIGVCEETIAYLIDGRNSSFMWLGVIGVNYSNADANQRTSVLEFFQNIENNPTFCDREIQLHWVLLCTCHRVELYYHSDGDYERWEETVCGWLDQLQSISGIRPYHYQHENCFVHLFSVTGGADSLELCETEIQGQVKRSYVQAYTQRKLSFALHFLFQKALKEGKTLRTQCSLPIERNSLVEVVRDILWHNEKVKQYRCLFVGFSEINRKIAAGLQQYGFQHLCFCSKHPEKVPYACIPRNPDIFQKAFDVFFLGTSALRHEFPDLSLSSFEISGSHRIVFDFNVPKTFQLPITSDHVQLFDMDFLSDCLHSCVTQARHDGERVAWRNMLEQAAHKQWSLFEKKCLRKEQSSELAICNT